MVHLLAVCSLLFSPLGMAISIASPATARERAPAWQGQEPAVPAAVASQPLLLAPPLETPLPPLTATQTITPTVALTFTLTTAPLPTPAATTSPTPTLTATSTPTPTLTPIPALTITPPPLPALSLGKQIAPQTAAPGQIVTCTLTLSNAGPGPALDLVLHDPLPRGLEYRPGSAPGAEYDAGQRSLTWRLPRLESGQRVAFSLAAQVTASAGEKLQNVATLTAALDASPPLTATASLAVAEPGFVLRLSPKGIIQPETGGTLRSADGRVEIYFPPGAVDEPLEVTHRPLEPVRLPPDRHVFYRFQLSAWPADRPEAVVSEFTRPVTVTVVYSDSELAGSTEQSPRLVRWDEVQRLWAPVAAGVDRKARQVTARLSHFSIYGLEGEDDVYFAPRIEAGQVSLYTGDASFSYELETPAGAGGLHLPLTLRYSGGVPNGLAGWDNTDSGWLGVGWSLEPGSISQDGTWLSLDGVSARTYWITQTASQDVTETEWDGGPYTGTRVLWSHRFEDERFWKIESDLFSGTCTGACAAENIGDKGRWDAWDRGGTHYVFGSTEYYTQTGGCTLWDGGSVPCGSGSLLARPCLNCLDGNPGRKYAVYKLDTVEDTHGNRLQIDYQVFARESQDPAQIRLKESYPAHIRYTTNAQAGDPDGHAEYDVEFLVMAKDEDVQGDKGIAETGYLLKEIKIWYQRSAGETKQLVRRYEFEYEDYDDPDYYLLTSITQVGPDGQALPATEFAYSLRDIGWGEGGAYCPAQRPFLEVADNGYGGQLTFGHQTWSEYESECIYRQTVQQEVASSGIGVPITHTYTYTDADVETDDGQYKSFIGFERVTEESDPAADRRTETRFHDTGGKPGDKYRGKVEEVWTRDQQGQVYAHTVMTYTDACDAGGCVEDVRFVYAGEVVQETCGDGGCQSQKTAYHYDTKWQNCGGAGPQYGNVTRVLEYDSARAATPYRSTLRGYCPNTEAWIVDRTAFVNVYEGAVDPVDPGAEGLEASTLYIYGEDPHWNQAVNAEGELRGVRRLLAWDPYDTVDQRFWYDDYGNVTEEVAYNSYGDAGSWASAQARSTTTAYDGLLHTFPVTVTNPLGHQVRTEYYGLNGPPLTAGGAFFGQASSVQDLANGLATAYHYDSFGRLTAVIRPGDSAARPTLAYAYDDEGWPPSRATRQREEHDSDKTLDAWQYYDGLGRPIQTQGEGEAAGQIILSDRRYDAAGRVERESLPYATTAGGGTYRPPTWSEPYSAYAYDPLGRSTAVTHPDGTAVAREYDYEAGLGWTTRTWDENGHRQDHFSDPFGRLVRVQEWWGAGGGQYHTTRYAYDLLDNLTDVWDAEENHTRMAYDVLGRKTAMDDPDMGSWSYVYNPVGTLASQTDARPQTVITFTYDALDRLTGKDYDGGGDEVSYYYDGQTCAGCPAPQGRVVGQRTAMETAESWAVYHYDDLRGRLSAEARWISGAPGGWYETGYSYDALDRLVATTYPDGEVLATTYNRQGLPETLAGGDSYVDEVEYNALGQIQLLASGAGATTSYVYHGEAGSPDPDRDSYRLWRMRTTAGGDEWLRLEYDYDAVGNVATITDTIPSGSQVQSFGYDDLDRLTAASATGGSLPSYGRSYTYGPSGNLKSKGGMVLSYPDAGRPRPHAVTSTSSDDSFGYDDNGNMTERVEQGVTYLQAWDAENRLASVTNQATGEATTFAYDGDGALVKKVDPGGTTFYPGRHYEVHVPAAGGTQAAASAPSAALEIAALEATARAVDQEAGAVAEDRCLAEPEAAGCEGWRVVRGGAAREGPFLEDPEGEETPPPAGTEGGSGQPQRAPASGLPDLGFESGEGWSEVTNEVFPATSFYWGTSNTAEPHGGSHAYALSNHSYGYLESVPITVTAGTAYSLTVQMRGELDPEDSHGKWRIWVRFYEAGGGYLGRQLLAMGGAGSLTTEWSDQPAADEDKQFTTLTETVTVRVQLVNYMNSGWVAFDDVSLRLASGGDNLVPYPSFEEEGAGWSERQDARFPATSLHWGASGTAEPAAGEHAYALSNQAHGYLESEPIAVAAGTAYSLTVWLRGALDLDDSHGKWKVWARFYEAGGGYLGKQAVASGEAGSLDPDWERQGREFTTPAETATVRVRLESYLNSGWVAFDDVSLQLAGGGPQLVPTPGFEDDTGWSEVGHEDFPATSFYRGQSNTAEPRSGSWAYALSNHPYGYLWSDPIPVAADGLYELGAWIRGETCPERSRRNPVLSAVEGTLS